MAFEWERIQFPVQLAFGMTIDKSTGQTFDRVGINLMQAPFSHGQGYGAFGRVGSFEQCRVFIDDKEESDRDVTRNVVYTEVL